MVTPYQLVLGGAATILGLAWIADPLRMRRYQSKLMFFSGEEDDDVEPTKIRVVSGRIGGLVLTAFGVAFLLGMLP